MADILSIGYGNRPKAVVFDLLRRHAVARLADVRSVPYSRFSPAFSRGELPRHAGEAGLAYTYLGEALGGKPPAGAAAPEGLFEDGLRRLLELAGRERVALLCAELRPEGCHRFRLLGSALLRRGIDVLHIDVDGGLVAQSELERRVLKGQVTLDAGATHGWKPA